LKQNSVVETDSIHNGPASLTPTPVSQMEHLMFS